MTNKKQQYAKRLIKVDFRRMTVYDHFLRLYVADFVSLYDRRKHATGVAMKKRNNGSKTIDSGQ